MTDDVARRLERIEAQLARLTALIEALGVTSPTAPAGTREDETLPGEALSPGTGAETTGTAGMDEPVPYHQLLTDLFAAALTEETEECWRCLEALTHPDELQAPRALDHLRVFSWKRFRKAAGSYLQSDDPTSWVIATSAPESLPGDSPAVKLFLERRGASPAPVIVGREGGSRGPWRVRNLSL